MPSLSLPSPALTLKVALVLPLACEDVEETPEKMELDDEELAVLVALALLVVNATPAPKVTATKAIFLTFLNKFMVNKIPLFIFKI